MYLSYSQTMFGFNHQMVFPFYDLIRIIEARLFIKENAVPITSSQFKCAGYFCSVNRIREKKQVRLHCNCRFHMECLTYAQRAKCPFCKIPIKYVRSKPRELQMMLNNREYYSKMFECEQYEPSTDYLFVLCIYIWCLTFTYSIKSELYNWWDVWYVARV